VKCFSVGKEMEQDEKKKKEIDGCHNFAAEIATIGRCNKIAPKGRKEKGGGA